jgi:hypothetical protein
MLRAKPIKPDSVREQLAIRVAAAARNGVRDPNSSS